METLHGGKIRILSHVERFFANILFGCLVCSSWGPGLGPLYSYVGKSKVSNSCTELKWPESFMVQGGLDLDFSHRGLILLSYWVQMSRNRDKSQENICRMVTDNCFKSHYWALYTMKNKASQENELETEDVSSSFTQA